MGTSENMFLFEASGNDVETKLKGSLDIMKRSGLKDTHLLIHIPQKSFCEPEKELNAMGFITELEVNQGSYEVRIYWGGQLSSNMKQCVGDRCGTVHLQAEEQFEYTRARLWVKAIEKCAAVELREKDGGLQVCYDSKGYSRCEYFVDRARCRIGDPIPISWQGRDEWRTTAEIA